MSARRHDHADLKRDRDRPGEGRQSTISSGVRRDPGTNRGARRVFSIDASSAPPHQGPIVARTPSFAPLSFVDRLLAELPSLLRAARRSTRSESDAEDLVQSTVVRAIEPRAELRDEARMRGWLLRVQHSVLLNGVRGARNRLEVMVGGCGAESVPEPRGDLEVEIVERGFADEVEQALAALPPDWREALLLREVDELLYEEIAEVQGCPVGTVRSRLSRARQALVERLSGTHEETTWQAATASGSRTFRHGTTAK